MQNNALTWAEKIIRFRRFTISLILALVALSVPAPNSPFISGAQAGYGTGGCELSGTGGNTNDWGSPFDPYRISSAVELFEVIDCSGLQIPGQERYFLITSNIEVDGSSYRANPIGVIDGQSPRSLASAWIDGDGHEISYSMSVTEAEGGLFYKLENVTISDLVLRGSLTSTGTTTELDAQGSLAAIAKNSSFIRIANHVAISSSGELVVGGLVGYVDNNMHVENVSNYGQLSGQGYVGGLFGKVVGGVMEVSSFSNYADVTALDYGAAGAIGILTSTATANFTNVSNYGEISVTSAEGNSSGGLIAIVDIESQVSFDYVRNVGTVSAPVRYVGGVIGDLLSGTASISNSVNEGRVISGGWVGGVVGNLSATLSMTSVVNSGAVSVSAGTQRNVGGLIGYSSANGIPSLVSVSNRGAIAGGNNVGGLIGQHEGRGLIVSMSENVGIVSGSSSTGGLVGRLDGAGVATLSNVTNRATVSGLFSDIGGLIGWMDIRVGILQGQNLASVQALDGHAGGLVGGLDWTGTRLVLERSFNSGPVTGTTQAGGLFGDSQQASYFTIDSYNSGLVQAGAIGLIGGHDNSSNTGGALTRTAAFPAPSQAVASDGLVAGRTADVTVNSSYTFEASNLASSSTILELKMAGTYVDWNFDTVWGFGGCDLNNGYPVLRWAHEGATLYDYSCGVMSSSSPVVVPGNTPGNTSAANQAPFVYQGPMLESHQVTVVTDEAVVIEGQRLESITEALVGGKAAQINHLTSTSLAITIPDLQPGAYDLVVRGSHGVLTVSLKFKVIEPSKQVASSSAAIAFGDLLGFRWISKFDGNSRDLTEQQVVLVSTALGVFTNATTIVCWGYTKDSSPNDWALAHATKRAASLCNEVTALRDDVRVFVRLQIGVNRYAAMRATMQFWESKEPE